MATGAKPDWFTIKQAAEYLAVGEPTIYRWMREGRITFRKVGDSTRFLQEDLDAMVEVHPSERDVELVRTFCPVCHHPDLVDGKLRSTGLCYFQPAKTRFWTFLDSSIDTTGRMCSQCGFIMLVGNTEKVERLRPEAAE